MSTEAPQQEHEHVDLHPHDADAHTHPDEKEYWLVALFLAAITAAEIAMYYIDPDFLVAATVIGVLSVVKFATVAMFFMHLRFDSKLFRGFFVTGLVLAITVYLIVLSTFHFWSGGG